MRFVGIGVMVAVLALGGSLSATTAEAAAASSAGSQALPAWNPDAAIEEPMQLIVSVPEQHVNVYVGGKLVARSPVSTGRKGHATPTGIFSILDKRRHHRSNIYSRAPMPYMQRLTWSGIALHGSNSVPNYPASHGCVRLPPKFAKRLFGATGLGAHVIVTDGAPAPVEISHSNLFRPVPFEKRAVAASPQTARAVVAARAGASSRRGDDAEAAPVTAVPARDTSPVRILVTRRTGRELMRDVQTLLDDLGFDPGPLDGWMGRKTGKAIVQFQESRGFDKTGAMSDELVAQLYRAAGKGEPPTGHIYVRQNFAPVFDAPIAIKRPHEPLGAHLFTAMDFDADASEARWLAVTLDDGAPDPSMIGPGAVAVSFAPARGGARVALDRINIPAPVRERIADMLTPGSSLAISDDGISQETVPRGTDFVVLTR
ncbi:MAG: L,D-transpeptidase family protein [Hyphomicrobiales bacterium]|nr:L,D-transpeptidase family protein [Hyphomicrobiales bacterium]